jgi:hypothetical protein
MAGVDDHGTDRIRQDGIEKERDLTVSMTVSPSASCLETTGVYDF